MKLSFVIPAYNEEAYLPICLDAVLKEKKRGKYDIEIIVVNNASTDSTRKVALSYPGVILVDEPTKGLSAARQAGFLKATGDLIANIDSDSVLTPGWVDKVMEEFSKNPKLVALSGPFIYHDLSVAHNILVRLQYSLDYCVYILNRFVFKVSSVLQGGNFVVRKTSLDQIGGFNTDFVFWGEDANIAKRLNPLGPVIFTFALPIYSSGRRLKKEGVLVMSYKYGMNFLWTVFFDKPFSTSFIDIRQSASNQERFKTNIYNFNKALLYTKVASVFIVFGLFGGVAYVWDRTVENVMPINASASTVEVEEHPILNKINTSFVKMSEKIMAIENKF